MNNTMTMEEFRTLVGVAIGRASMCWSETPKGVFESSDASALVDEILIAATRLQKL